MKWCYTLHMDRILSRSHTNLETLLDWPWGSWEAARGEGQVWTWDDCIHSSLCLADTAAPWGIRENTDAFGHEGKSNYTMGKRTNIWWVSSLIATSPILVNLTHLWLKPLKHKETNKKMYDTILPYLAKGSKGQKWHLL